ncbi:PREDICTED: CKLF-like MARVEL transmembrane domain-containing protein 7, partial [Nestor notabilis]|uniref:CKLF-like MARVEL transmembrane domain-containing protein 7 n=1 Tax=Nestor notabilis TaxID=176057 RepID=UPI000523CC60
MATVSINNFLPLPVMVTIVMRRHVVLQWNTSFPSMGELLEGSGAKCQHQHGLRVKLSKNGKEKHFQVLPTTNWRLISLVVGFISVNNSPWTDYSAYSYFQIVTMCDLVMILFFYIIHIFRIYRKLTCVSWPLAEFLHYLIGTILLLIASIVAASKSYNLTGLVAGATFGFLATILCVLSIWSSYKVSCITQST